MLLVLIGIDSENLKERDKFVIIKEGIAAIHAVLFFIGGDHMKTICTRRIRNAACLSFVAAMIVALCIIAASANCYADDDAVLKLELGQNHETLAAAMAASPQNWLDESYLQFDTEERVTNVVRDGTAIKIILPDSYSRYTYTGVMPKLYPSFYKALQFYAGERNYDYFFHNGEMVYCPSVYSYVSMGNQRTFGFGPKESYEDASAFSRERDSKKDDPVIEDQPLYVLWDRPIESMEVQISIPECGEEVSLSDSGYGYEIPDNRPEVTCPEHTRLYKLHDDVDHTYWANSCSIAYGQIKDPFKGKLKGGNKYIAAAYIGADWGYYFAKDVDVTVNGEPAEPKSRRSPIWPSEYELFKYIEPEHVFDGKWVMERKPTCSEKGIESCYCTACGGKKTRETKTDPDAHEWGPWKVTRSASAARTGEKQRSCKHDPAHVEKVEIPARGTLMAQMKAKGSNAMNLTWTMANDVDGYDIFFARCNHSGKNTSCRLVESVKGNGTFRWEKTGLRKRTPYKAYVKAYVIEDGKKQYVAVSLDIHAFTSGGDKSFTNPKGVTVKKKKITLKCGKTYKIKGSVKKLQKKKKLMSKGHAPKLRYMSSDKSIATVNSRGKIKALKKGSCQIYVYAVNGMYKTVTVRVK